MSLNVSRVWCLNKDEWESIQKSDPALYVQMLRCCLSFEPEETETSDQIHAWLNDHCTDIVYHDDDTDMNFEYVYFAREADAAAFRLTWDGHEEV